MHDIRGNLKEYEKLDIAIEYLDLALSEYVKGRNLFVVLNLAGAAEEMLGKIVKINNKQNSHEKTHRLFRNWYAIAKKEIPNSKILTRFILSEKNGVKHIDGDNDLTIEIDLKRETREIIRKALDNYNQIPGLSNTQQMLDYYRYEKTL